MSKSSSSSSTLIVIVLTLVAISATVQGRLIGGRMHMGDVTSNKEVQELGRFSVDHYNRINRLQLLGEGGRVEAEEPLRFVKVVDAQTQVVAGIKYFLKVEALHGGQRRVFDAEVVVMPWLPTSKHVLSFSPSASLVSPTLKHRQCRNRSEDFEGFIHSSPVTPKP